MWNAHEGFLREINLSTEHKQRVYWQSELDMMLDRTQEIEHC